MHLPARYDTALAMGRRYGSFDGRLLFRCIIWLGRYLFYRGNISFRAQIDKNITHPSWKNSDEYHQRYFPNWEMGYIQM